jgi:protocatechuate 3,4-dioxygenase beta subunit
MGAAALVLMLVLAQVATPGMPPRPGAPPAADTHPKGTSSIRGRITAADTGRPLRRARVTMTAEPLTTLTTPKSTSTNVRGEYELKDLPAGRYQIRVQRSGYLSIAYGQRRSTEPARPVDLADGQRIEKMDFALPRMGVVSGRVVDETGEPVAGVTVWTMRQEYFRGRRRFVPAGSGARTDDTGQYRILGVAPGAYLVMAWLRETWTAGPERRTFGYACTFFPGTASAADALRVKVAEAQEVPNTDLALVASPAASVSGTATRPDGAPLAGSTVTLSQEFLGSSGGMSTGVSSATVAADGSWRIRNIAPGEYQLEVSSSGATGPPERTSITVVLQGTDVEGIALVIDSGGTITGQVITDDGQALPASTTRLRAIAETLGPDQRRLVMPGDDNGVVDGSGHFTVTGARGRSALRLGGLPRGWVVKTIEGGGRDYSEAPIEVRGGQKLDVRIVITNRFPEVTGRITDDRGNPAEGAVLLFPSDEAKWFDSAVLRMARPDQSGIFRMQTVRPGDYLAVALESVESWQASDPEFLEELRSRATRVTIREGQAEMLNLKVAR